MRMSTSNPARTSDTISGYHRAENRNLGPSPRTHVKDKIKMKQKDLYNTVGSINITKAFWFLSPANTHREIKCIKMFLGF